MNGQNIQARQCAAGSSLPRGEPGAGRFVLFLAGLIFLAFPGVMLGVRSFVFRDFGLFAYPSAYYQRECFWQGELPFWNPYNSCGIPMLAQWNTMCLYPPALWYMLFPLNWGLSVFCLLHLLWGGMGMFLLARRYTGDPLASAVAGIAFAFGGVAQNFLMWPSHIATFSWIPWVLMLSTEGCRSGGRKLVWAALAGGLQMLAGGPESILFTWCLAAAMVFLESGEAGARPRAFGRLVLLGLLVGGFAAAQLLPFFELAAHSQRDRHFSDLRSAMPATGWMNYLVPLAFGNSWEAGVFKQDGQSWTSSYYVGIGILLLAMASLWKNRDRRVWLLAIISLVALIMAHGDSTVIYTWLGRILPVFKLMTFPVKFVLVMAFAAPLMAAVGLARVRQSRVCSRKLLLQACLILAILTLVSLFWQWQFPSRQNEIGPAIFNGLTRIGFLLATALVVTALLGRGTQPSPWALSAALMLAIWLDLRTHVPGQNPTTDPSLFAPGIIRKELAMTPQPALGGSRVMLSPAADAVFDTTPVQDVQTGYLARRLGYFSNCNLLDKVPKVTGFFSLYPYEAYQISRLLYLNTNSSFPRLSDFLGVSQVTAPGEYTVWRSRESFLPMVTAGQMPVFLDDTNTVAQLIRPEFDPLKTVFLPLASREQVAATGRTPARAEVKRFANHSIEIETESATPALVVVAQTYYHRWRALVDGAPSRLLRANYAFQAVQVPAGKHRVRLDYRDTGFRLGMCITAASLLVLAFMVARGAKR